MTTTQLSSSSNCSTIQQQSPAPIIMKTEAKMHVLVEILITDPVLLSKWSQFCDQLECPAQDKLRWDRGIGNGTRSFYGVFSEMLNSWVMRNPNKTVDDLCTILRGIQCVVFAEKLESNFKTDEVIHLGNNFQTERNKTSEFVKSGKEIKWPITHGLFVPTANFTGRDEQLQELNDNFNTTNLVLITGFGGIGKTEFCRKFTNDILNSNVSRVWLHGESLETLGESVLKLAGELGVKNDGDSPISEYFEYVTSFILENCTRWLVIIDNVDVIYEEVVKVIRMAKNEKKIFVIVTSRDSKVLEGAGITMKLDVLSELQARKMLQKSMSDLTDSDADKLGELVEYFPLALQQAVAYIKQQRNHFRTRNYSVSNYVREFEVKNREMLGHELNKFDHDYSMTTLITWDMTISKMSDNAVEILKIIAYLDPDGVQLHFFEKVCRHMGVVGFDEGLDMLDKYCLVKIDEVVSVHRLVQEVMRGKVDDAEYTRNLFDSVLLVSWNRLRINWTDRVHLNSVCKFVWKCDMWEMYDFSDALLVLLERDRIDCAEKLTKLQFPNIQFSSEFGIQKREFLEKVLLWLLLCRDSRTTSEEITKGEYNVDRHYDNYLYSLIPLKSIEAQVRMSVKYFGERNKITFALKIGLVRKLFREREFDKGLELFEKELATFPFEGDDSGLTKFLFKTIEIILWNLDEELESYTPSRLASLEKIMNHFVKTYPNNSVEWMELEAHWCDLKGDYKKALEMFMEVGEKGINSDSLKVLRECKIIELIIKLTNFDVTIVEQFKRDLGGEVFELNQLYFTLRGLQEILPIYEAYLGEGHELTIGIKLAMAWKLRRPRNIVESRKRCIQLCEQVLRSQVDGEYKDAFEYLCIARNIEKNYDEQKKILQNLLESKILELGVNHSNTKVVLRLLQELSVCIKNSNDEKRPNNSIKQKASDRLKKLRCSLC